MTLTSRVSLALLLFAGAALLSRAEAAGPDEKDFKAVRDKAVAYLKERQAADGGFSSKFGPGITALAIAGLIRNEVSADDPVVKKALDALGKSARKDGGIYDKGLQNYTTCVAVMAFKEANVGGKYDALLKKASDYLKKLQFDDEANDEFRFGGLTYGDKKGRPDLSNTQFFIEAMIAAGVPKDDPALKNALKFVARCQNYAGKGEDKGNDLAFAKKATEKDKGGFTYVNDPDDKKHSNGEGGLRSQGAMTYAGLKSFLYSGVAKDDPRVQSALKWVRSNYTLEENPGLGQSGLFYYYNTFGKAMEAIGEDQFKDASGKAHDWRKDLFEAIKSRQNKEGGFSNKADKAFGEGDPNLATAFALIALSYSKPTK